MLWGALILIVLAPLWRPSGLHLVVGALSVLPPRAQRPRLPCSKWYGAAPRDVHISKAPLPAVWHGEVGRPLGGDFAAAAAAVMQAGPALPQGYLEAGSELPVAVVGELLERFEASADEHWLVCHAATCTGSLGALCFAAAAKGFAWCAPCLCGGGRTQLSWV